ncbi:hypothetical protein D0962_34625 [Leptolyngbyaceae cyanobacterium CCMR0082]|uniref:Uncharacterized protein n=1 Tax=Adonisia turfae CCMR0082 TaxID=2304604 RepID=A0A6M0SHH8_9CYAN|nr:hypothetical protein [Adonisia turfae]MDV3348646.1 hypothetical protein [Leptothoe sp. LEGE 181152]NEZ67834.1 hypothetical protein [Adonisia turfae CCMR0082]
MTESKQRKRRQVERQGIKGEERGLQLRNRRQRTGCKVEIKNGRGHNWRQTRELQANNLHESEFWTSSRQPWKRTSTDRGSSIPYQRATKEKNSHRHFENYYALNEILRQPPRTQLPEPKQLVKKNTFIDSSAGVLQRCFDKNNPDPSKKITIQSCQRPAFFPGFPWNHGCTIFKNQDGSTTSLSLGNPTTETENDYLECIESEISFEQARQLHDRLKSQKKAYNEPPEEYKEYQAAVKMKTPRLNYAVNYSFVKGNCNNHQLDAYQHAGLKVPTPMMYRDTMQNISADLSTQLSGDMEDMRKHTGDQFT